MKLGFPQITIKKVGAPELNAIQKGLIK